MSLQLQKFDMNKVFVVIPAYNEEETIGEVIDGVKKYCQNIIVVDDGSKDKTYEIADQKGIKALKHKINLGKGAALKTGCEVAMKKKADAIVIMDADGQHSAEDVLKLVNEIKQKDADIVFAARKFNKKMPIAMLIGNKFLSWSIKNILRLRINDSQCGLKAFKSSIYPKIKWNSQDYRVETEIIVNMSRHKIRYSEVYIETIYKDSYKGTTPIDGLKIFFSIINWKFL